jgi:dTDP-4-dehydrorhamnose reductase
VTRVLLTGSAGQVGRELTKTLSKIGEVCAFDRHMLDLSDPAAIRQTVRALKPDIIVNAGAYTAVDRAEAEPALAMAVNATAPGVLAQEARRLGAWLVHYSTDYVFNGVKSSPYSEDDLPNPLSVYGRSKLAGDTAVQTSNANHLILRTSWVYGATGRNFLVTIRKLAAERPELRIVNDQYGAPTWCRDIATATEKILTHVLRMSAAPGEVSGIYNLSAA